MSTAIPAPLDSAAQLLTHARAEAILFLRALFTGDLLAGVLPTDGPPAAARIAIARIREARIAATAVLRLTDPGARRSRPEADTPPAPIEPAGTASLAGSAAPAQPPPDTASPAPAALSKAVARAPHAQPPHAPSRPDPQRVHAPSPGQPVPTPIATLLAPGPAELSGSGRAPAGALLAAAGTAAPLVCAEPASAAPSAAAATDRPALAERSKREAGLARALYDRYADQRQAG